MPPAVEQPATEESTSLAPQWKVLLHNDDITTMEFVVWLLRTVFHKRQPEAHRLMMEVHEAGSALITVASFELAEHYVDQVRSLARPRGYPLTASMEPV
jgi:ATP-dependent Clp protease adaptor protein ClpS